MDSDPVSSSFPSDNELPPTFPRGNHKFYLIVLFLIFLTVLLAILVAFFLQRKTLQSWFNFGLSQSNSVPSEVKPQVIRVVNKAKKSGEFLIEDYSKPKPPPTTFGSSQFVVEGVYTLNTNKITANVSRSIPAADIDRTSEYIADLEDRFRYWLKFDLIDGGKVVYSSILAIIPQKDTNEIHFKVVLPYYPKAFLKITDQHNKELFREGISI